MRIHYLQHVSFEDLGLVESWAKNHGHTITSTELFNEQKLPGMEEFDWLFIMGGPMNIYEEKIYPWLSDEKKFIKNAVESSKIVLGICLGAQLIADVLGGRVERNRYKEIGWFPVTLKEDVIFSNVFKTLPGKFMAFHWHGDTFKIPPGASWVAMSEACDAQAFEFGKVIGLQFHIEYSEKSIDLMIKNCGDELVDGEFIQGSGEILSQLGNLKEMNRIMGSLLDNIEKEYGK